MIEKMTQKEYENEIRKLDIEQREHDRETLRRQLALNDKYADVWRRFNESRRG